MQSRRTIINAAIWSAPAITVATAAPAFATSHIEQPDCAPVGYGRKTGEGQNTKDYFVMVNCTSGGAITAVDINVREYPTDSTPWYPMTDLGGGNYAKYGTQDSAIKKNIRITFASGLVWQGEVEFPVIKG